MTRVLGGQSLTKEDVAEVSPAVGALDFNTLAVTVGQTLDSAGDLVVESRPAAVNVELVCGAVKLGIAAMTDVCPSLIEVIVLAGVKGGSV